MGFNDASTLRNEQFQFGGATTPTGCSLDYCRAHRALKDGCTQRSKLVKERRWLTLKARQSCVDFSPEDRRELRRCFDALAGESDMLKLEEVPKSPLGTVRDDAGTLHWESWMRQDVRAARGSSWRMGGKQLGSKKKQIASCLGASWSRG